MRDFGRRADARSDERAAALTRFSRRGPWLVHAGAPMVLAALVALAAVTISGCLPLIGRGSPRAISRQPYRAALYLSPELDMAEAAVVTGNGTDIVVRAGDELRDEIIKATGGIFAAVALTDGPRFTGPLRCPDLGQGIWPETKERLPIPPDLVIACYLADLEAHILPGGDCVHCVDGLFLRIDLYVEIRDHDGRVRSSTKVTGQGINKQGQHPATPLSVRFQEAMAEAARTLAGEYRLALVNMDIDLPAGRAVPGTTAERPADRAARPFPTDG